MDWSSRIVHMHTFIKFRHKMFICDVDYSYFCVCTFAENEMQGLHIEQITRQPTFWEENKRKAEYFLGHACYQRS